MIDSSKFDWKKHILDCFNSTFFCTLATWERESPWANPVYFAWDDKFNIYFISQPNSRHMVNINKNQHVALTIFSTAQKPGDDVIGSYVEGTASIVLDHGVDAAYGVYYKRRFPETGKSDTPPSEHKGENAEWKFVKIAPTKIYYFDTRYFDEERMEVPFNKLVKSR